jgi:isoleucyl-tRNA synthetase
MVGNRPDWCISRQRSWGVPMAFFVHRKTGHVLRDSSVDQRILDAFEEIGADAWYAMDPQEFLGTKYEAREYKQVFDVLDVWFESGCTHAFVLDKRDDQKWPADLYLEGSDQHRGWFQSSLLQATATRGQPPFKTVVTHGFVNDKTGRKMSKSDGNVLSPITIADQLGADIFRLWSATVDWKNDMRLGDEALRGAQDMYRKFRNTLRFVAGNLDTEVAPVEMNYNELPLLEQFVLTRLKAFADDLPDAIEMFEIGAWLNKLHAFCDTELSRLYFDIRKDTLYCDRPDDPVRMACQHVLWWLYRCLSRWLAPVLVFTTEELFLVVEGSDRLKSIHFDQYPSLPEEWSTFPRQYEWVELMSVRKQFLSEMEDLRECKKLTKPSRARVTLQGSHSALRRIDKVQLLELCGVAEIELVPNGNHTAHCCEPGLQISVDETALAECERCRLSNIPEASCDTLCQRCEGIVRADLKEAV